jgi:hypothetical protein
MLLTGLAGVILSLIFLVISLYGKQPLEKLTRPESGTGSRTESLQVEFGGETYPLDVEVWEIPYEEEELTQMLQTASDGLESLFLKENTSINSLMYDVYMPSVFPDSEISIQWYLDSWKYMEPDGTLKNESLTEEISGRVQAVLTLENQTLTWERDYVICPPADPSEEQKLKILENQIEQLQEDSSVEIVLPKEILGESVVWYPKKDQRWLAIAGLTILALCAMAAGRHSEDEKKEKLRERDMQLAYPDIVNRLSLYMGAGISTRGAWERIVANYEQKRGEKQETGYAYEEMRTTLYEMQSGIPEAAAYERFGTRCRMPSYLKLGTLLSQNLRRGTRNLADLLAEEAREAFEDRKALAKKLGEECESKLLLPMILLLLIILVMIMYPAVISFQV